MALPSELRRRYRHDLVGAAVLAAAMAVIGVSVSNTFYLSVMVNAGIHAIAAVGLSLVLGYAGLASLGQAAFFGIGAYATANLVGRADWPSIAALAAATAVSAAFGYVIARPLLRLSSHYLAMATLAFGVVMYILFAQLHGLTGGLDPGIIAMPPFAIFGRTMGGTAGMFWVVAVALLATVLCGINLIHSRVGRGLLALRSSEIAAAGLGIDIVRSKLAIFAFAAGITGLAGGLFAFFARSFNASAFGFSMSIELLMMVVIGSLSTVWGGVCGAVVLAVLPNLLEGFEGLKAVVYGAVMTLVMIFMPNGLVDALVRGVLALRRRAAP